jgi:TetR/AcrR family transcriptional repressor of nem operon
MKVSRETMARHREQILASAAKRFRECGFNGVSVSDLMKEAGLTHGGFYGHFDSKEELAALASVRALNDVAAKWQKWIEEAPGDPLEAIASNYLSLHHYDHPETGCPFAAVGSEIARQPASVKKAVTEGVQRFLDVIGRIVPGRTKAVRKKKAIVVLANLIGGMVLARIVSDPGLRDEVLTTIAASVPHSVREH